MLDSNRWGRIAEVILTLRCSCQVFPNITTEGTEAHRGSHRKHRGSFCAITAEFAEKNLQVSSAGAGRERRNWSGRSCLGFSLINFSW
jgi:hypothetical protein